MRPIGYDGNNPTSVAEWLESLELGDYTKSFLINGYTSMELVKKIWEIELINVSLLLVIAGYCSFLMCLLKTHCCYSPCATIEILTEEDSRSKHTHYCQ